MEKTKATNPKDAIGILKLPFSCLPWRALTGVALAMLEGALKYRRHNYRVAGVRSSVYFDSTLRHLVAWWEGEDHDPDSSLHHIDKAIASLLVLRDGMYEDNWQDDRPPKSQVVFMQTANDIAASMISSCPNPLPLYTEENKHET